VYAYFVHSYYAEPDDPDAVVATADYGVDFPAVVANEGGQRVRHAVSREERGNGAPHLAELRRVLRGAVGTRIRAGAESEPVLQPVVRAGLCGSQAVDLLVGQIDRSGREILRELGGRARRRRRWAR